MRRLFTFHFKNTRKNLFFESFFIFLSLKEYNVKKLQWIKD